MRTCLTKSHPSTNRKNRPRVNPYQGTGLAKHQTTSSTMESHAKKAFSKKYRPSKIDLYRRKQKAAKDRIPMLMTYQNAFTKGTIVIIPSPDSDIMFQFTNRST